MLIRWGRCDKRTKPGREPDNHYQSSLSRSLIPTRPLSLSPISPADHINFTLYRNHCFFSRAYNRSFLSGLRIASPPTEYKNLSLSLTGSSSDPNHVYTSPPQTRTDLCHNAKCTGHARALHPDYATQVCWSWRAFDKDPCRKPRGTIFTTSSTHIIPFFPTISRKSLSAYSVLLMSSRCTPLRSTRTKIGCPLIVKRYAALLAYLNS